MLVQNMADSSLQISRDLRRVANFVLAHLSNYFVEPFSCFRLDEVLLINDRMSE